MFFHKNIVKLIRKAIFDIKKKYSFKLYSLDISTKN